MNNHLPNLKHLQYLIALDKYQHFNKAAQSCFVSQSTLSSAILKLEQLLNCQLIEREHKSFVFTHHGKIVVTMAKSLIQQAVELSDFSKSQGVIDQGSVYLGCIPTIAPFLLTDFLEVCQQALPNIELFIKEDTTENLLAQLANGDIDVAILAEPIEHQYGDSFRTTHLGIDHFYLAGNKALVEQCNIDGHYRNLPDGSVFLLSNEHCLTEHAVSACKLVDKEKINAFYATSISTLLQMTIHHQGLTFLPEMAINKGISGHEFIHVAAIKGKAFRNISLVERKNSSRTETFQLITDLVTTLFIQQNNK